jgi:uncharacterized protein (DUF1778 family)
MPTMKHHNSDAVARINFRLPNEMKEVVERAATASGLTLTDFAIQALLERANEVLRDYEARKLSDRDRDQFLALLDEEPVPHEALRAAFAAHDRLIAP